MSRDREDIISRNDSLDARVQARAVRLHQQSRDRALHFNTPVMVDSAMDVMLTLLIGQVQNTKLSLAAIALANRLTVQDCAALVQRLADAGLVTSNGEEVAGNHLVALTDRGSTRMRGFIMDHTVN